MTIFVKERNRTVLDILDYIDKTKITKELQESLHKFWNSNNSEIILPTSTDEGETFARLSLEYIIYKLSCLPDPQKHYGLLPGSEITLVAPERYIAHIMGVYEVGINWLLKKFVYRYEGNYILRFPRNIVLKPMNNYVELYRLYILSGIVDSPPDDQYQGLKYILSANLQTKFKGKLINMSKVT